MEIKPGYKTTEAWLCAIAIACSALAAAGMLAPESKWGQLVGTIGVVLTALGYNATRTGIKRAQIESPGDEEAATEKTVSEGQAS
jgi:hypothetical protein